MSYVPDTMRKRIYDKDNNQKIDIDAIPTITRDKLEYPTEDVSFAYLSAINKILLGGLYAIHCVTRDQFTDKAVVGGCQSNDGPWLIARYTSVGNFYVLQIFLGASTKDFELGKYVNKSWTSLATESVNLQIITRVICISCSGSTIKGLRYEMSDYVDPLNLPTADGVISATDTTFSAGHFGYRYLRESSNHGGIDPLTAYLKAPQTRLPPAKSILEVGIEKDYQGNCVNQLKQNLVPICQLSNIPNFLKAEAKKYELLKQRGFTDEEIKLLFGDIQTHVDLASVTWGAFDHKTEHNTMLIVITDGNPHVGEKAITEQIEHAKSKGLKVLSPPRDYSEAIEQYRQLKKDFPEWIAGKDNFAYHTLGHPDLEAFQAADTYYGNVIDGIKSNAYKNVPSFEMYRTLAMWKERLKRGTVVKSEAEKHIKKLEEVERRGW